MSTTAESRPGCGESTHTRSERNTLSEMLCVTKITVLFVLRQIFSRSMWSFSRVNSSSAENGSSISSISGRIASALAIPTLCCMPPESWFG